MNDAAPAIRPIDLTGIDAAHPEGETTAHRVGVAAAETAAGVTGVHHLGGTAARALDAASRAIRGTSTGPGVTVSEEAGDTVIDIDLVVEYPTPVQDVVDETREQVARAARQIAAGSVRVNIRVTDVHGPFDDEQSPAGAALERAKDAGSDALEKAEDAGSDALEKTKAAGSEGLEKAKAAGSEAADRAREAGDRIQDASADAAARAQDAGSRAADAAKEIGAEAADRAKAAGAVLADSAKADVEETRDAAEERDERAAADSADDAADFDTYATHAGPAPEVTVVVDGHGDGTTRVEVDGPATVEVQGDRVEVDGAAVPRDDAEAADRS
ncbi:Asp23/Gls24 family envelope stress response protein [Clavibacter michiganensis]|uniref:Asp23/Gls24 family envelope stress response protein n=1 Tax=Clavibacter michiganensis subsp. michiganensis TaxID=33013 RepID=A0A251XNE7_CLAMM|nr:Asp23/Gls24 family envelope stress response protein [Clavibacter michiganensis]MBE3077343.1 Asp23/Gls24 family envelope stress response protein [Clavibacter michiganensis subsp. michiganensis]MDO4045630.1 Asp23/Gls24 family envelope stress response protein [Clavibacter michiganensis]MDO4054828.1 Asp23/Gls24 family envelope stress response protein [Clavibacter michiganensis]MDO4057765.1 Asp23/Gls24 family envelope stress response protein [Clavibacter michiganensis]MDO4070042.1 Asp23/Gls24 fa